ncbi:MAG: 16S rRNA (cytosine(1402)-N(4))-methyltransferase RsmH [Porticoccaceae bacterium]|nr:16S rRNA (cytosine(1402)-N(4))-methyltransferase RsmH [Porticoccaceae bacterium]
MHEHSAVLLDEAVDSLIVDPDGYYIDGTYGRGGHTSAILQRLSGRGRILAIDKDPDAIADGRARFDGELRVTFQHGSFAAIKDATAQFGVVDASGILLDLGVSSPQLDQAERGFSFLRDGPLDMRMDSTCGVSAAEWLSVAAEGDIATVLKSYGDERYARRIAAAIVRERALESINSTARLAKIVATAHPSWERGRHPATKSFQAIRIHINNELQDLDDFLSQVVDALKIGGRLVVISFHSLEDRRVKRFMRDQQRGRVLPKNIPLMEVDRGVRLVKIGRAIKPSSDEVDSNARARSAVMRVAERVA